MPFAIRREFDYAEVNTQNTVGFNQWRVWNAHGRHQVEIAVDKSEVGFALTESEKPALIGSAHKCQFQPSVNRPDRDLPTLNVPVEYTVIESNRACRLKRALSTLIQLIRIRYFADAADNHLRGQTRCPTLGGVLPFVQGVLLKGLVLPSPRTDTVTNSVCGNHRALQGIRLVRSNDQFHLCSKFQRIDIMPTITRACQCQSNLFGQFLPRINAKGVSWGLWHPASALPAYTKGLL